MHNQYLCLPPVGARRLESRNVLDWDSLRYFLEVARTQRVSAAARKLGVEHTTVSRRIRALETELDTLLFEKSRSAGFVLTDDGQRLFVHAEQMESTVHTARETCRASVRPCRATCVSAPLKLSLIHI